jgi:hypothetical protein
VRAVSDSKKKADAKTEADPGVLARDGVRSLPGGSVGARVGPLLSSARHELRSPLQSIQGFAELLGSESYGGLSEEQHTFVQHILQGSLELGSVVEACLELAELELLGRPLERTASDLRGLLADALDSQRNGSTAKVHVHFGSSVAGQRVRLERDALRRSLAALLTAMTTGQSNTFSAEIEHKGEHASLLLTRDGGSSPAASALPGGLSLGEHAGDALLGLDELTERAQAPRSLIWLRLSGALLALQEGELRVSERLDRAEVRFRLCSTH